MGLRATIGRSGAFIAAPPEYILYAVIEAIRRGPGYGLTPPSALPRENPLAPVTLVRLTVTCPNTPL